MEEISTLIEENKTSILPIGMTKKQLLDLFILSCTKETSNDPDRWSTKNPGRFHCLPIALVIKELFGGSLSHYTYKVTNPTKEISDRYQVNGKDITKDTLVRYFIALNGEEIDLMANSGLNNLGEIERMATRIGKNHSMSVEDILSLCGAVSAKYYALLHTIEKNLPTVTGYSAEIINDQRRSGEKFELLI